jgi:hypothetical protein
MLSSCSSVNISAMTYRNLVVAMFCLLIADPLRAQVSQQARFEIQRTVLAEKVAARIAMPFGGDGIELTDSGTINEKKRAEQIEENGQSIETGKIVTITQISFDSKSIEIELDGGGKNKKSFLEHIQVGMGGGGGSVGRPVGNTDEELKKAKGSKIVLKFAGKVPSDLTPEQLRQLLSVALDFNKQNFMKTGVDALPAEFREAVLAKEARIGMDRNTVLMAMGSPDQRVREKDSTGANNEDWIYYGRGVRTTFVKFNEDNVVISVREFGPINSANQK